MLGLLAVLLFGVAVLLVGILIWRKSHPKPIGILQVIEFLWAADGWIEIADDQYRPIFQGKLLTVTEDCLGLAVGVLLEEGCNPDLIKDLKAARRIAYLDAGKILAKVIFDLHSDLILTHLTDTGLRSLLEHYVQPEANIDVKLAMTSAEIQFANSREDEQRFSEMWTKVDVQPGQVSAGRDRDPILFGTEIVAGSGA
jgi:hypothetical protein